MSAVENESKSLQLFLKEHEWDNTKITFTFNGALLKEFTVVFPNTKIFFFVEKQ
jgi:hypothetical protein